MTNESVGEDGRGAADLRRTAFFITAAGFVLFLYLFSPFSSLFLGWFVDFEDNISHRVHEVTFGLLFAAMLLGIAVQLRRPEANVAGIQQAIVVAVVLSVVVAASTGWEWTALLYVTPPLVIAALHPSRAQVFRIASPPQGGLAYLVAFAAIPFLIGFGDEFDKAVNEVRGHQAHWGGMATFALVVPVLGLLAATKAKGWRLVAWTTGLAMVVYGVTSTLFPFDASARTDAKAIIAIIWGLLFVATAERAARSAAIIPDELPAVSADKPVLRRARQRLGGVAVGIARHVGVRPAVIRALFMLPIVGQVGWLLARVLIPLEQEGDPVAPSGRTHRNPLVKAAVIAPALGSMMLIGLSVYSVAESLSPPPVPHDIESTNAATCLECHGTGKEGAPVIEAATHNSYDEPRRFISFNLCADCHRLPEVTATGAAGSGRQAISLIPEHRDALEPLTEADIARARLAAPAPGRAGP